MSDMAGDEYDKTAEGMAEHGNSNSQITAAERRSREEALKAARASVELEGFKISPFCEELSQRFINGEIEIDDAIRMLNEAYKKHRS